MRIEDREEFVDLVAQAVIDRIEERDRIAGLVNLVVARVLELQKEQAQQASTDGLEEEIHGRDREESIGNTIGNGQLAH